MGQKSNFGMGLDPQHSCPKVIHKPLVCQKLLQNLYYFNKGKLRNLTFGYIVYEMSPFYVILENNLYFIKFRIPQILFWRDCLFWGKMKIFWQKSKKLLKFVIIGKIDIGLILV